MGGMGGSSKNSEPAIRYAPYLEAAHGQIINHDGDDEPSLSMFDLYNAALNQSPYADYTDLVVEEAFFGDGYAIEDFPTLYDIFGKFMASLDICDLWGRIYENVVHAPEIEAAISAHSAMLQDEIDTTIMPRFLAGMRDANAVMSSSFIIGKAIIADSHVKSVNKMAADIRLQAVDASAKLWVQHLDWNKSVVQLYAEYAKLYYNTKMEVDKTSLEYAAKDVLWNLNLLDYARSIIGALNGAAAAKSEKEPSLIQKLLGGAFGGASAGASFGLPGALLGGALGIAGAFF